MRHRLLALLLIFALMLAPAASASQAMGWELVREDTLLGPGVTMTTQQFWGDSIRDYRLEQYVTYSPGQGSLPVVYYGATVPATVGVINMGKAVESWGYRVLAGTNGDYFAVATGVPLGMVVTGGVLRTSSAYHYAVGFTADGDAFVGKPDLTITASFHGYDLSVSGGYNKTRETQGGYTLFSSDFGSATRGSGAGVNVVLRPVAVPEDYVAPQKPAPFLDPEPEREEPAEPSETEPGETENAEPSAWDLWQQAKAAWEQEMAVWRWDLAWSVGGFETLPAQLSIGGGVTCVVESVSEQSGGVSIPEGRLVMTIDKRGGEFLVDELAGLVPGEQVRLSVSSPDPRWNRASSAIGAFKWIVQDGVVASGLEAAAAPRTALGIKENGEVILYTMDGRRAGHSMGAGVTQVAKRLVELGCTQAVLFDGGGSTTFGATGALESTFTLQNRPSDGSQRPVPNGLFFVSPLQSTGELGSLYLQPHRNLMLAGARQTLSALGIDTGYYPMGGETVGNLTYTVQGPGSRSRLPMTRASTAQAPTQKARANMDFFAA